MFDFSREPTSRTSTMTSGLAHFISTLSENANDLSNNSGCMMVMGVLLGLSALGGGLTLMATKNDSAIGLSFIGFLGIVALGLVSASIYKTCSGPTPQESDESRSQTVKPPSHADIEAEAWKYYAY